MATFNSNVWNTVFGPTDVGGKGIVNIVGSILVPAGTGLATGDVLNFFRCRAGGHLRNVWIQNSDFATTAAPGTLGTYRINASGANAAGSAIDADALLTDLVFETAADRNLENYASDLTSAGGNFAAPFATLTEDFLVKAVVGTMNGAITTGAKYIKFTAELVYFGADQDTAGTFTYNGATSGSSATE